MGHDDADEADEPHGRHDCRRAERGGRDDDEANSLNGQAETARLRVAHAHHVEGTRGADTDQRTDKDVGQHHHDAVPRSATERAQQPDVDTGNGAV